MAEIPLILKYAERLRQIDLGYFVFLNEMELIDTPLAKMAYFSTIRKAYLKDPLPREEDQVEILRYLDSWMEKTQKEMPNI
jgi:hypothetical protein